MKTRQIKFWLAIGFATALLESSSLAQCQRQKLLASDGETYDRFGWSVAISGDWAAVGAYEEGDIAAVSGAVYMFHHEATGWIETQKLKASDAAFGAAFGSSVALDGGALAVGAPGDNYQGVMSAGAVYVFDLTGSTWSETVKLHAGDAVLSDDSFGNPMAMEGDRLLIGARYDDGPGVDSGAAYVFDRVGGTWTQTAKLVGSDVASDDGIGLSVALAGDRVILGAPYWGAGLGPGAAYVFENGAGGWQQTQKLLASVGAPGDYFGVAVALTGDLAAVGACARNTPASGSGTVYAFQKQASGWVQTQEFWADDTASGDAFGSVLACSADHLIVNSNVDAYGSAWDFRLSGSTWEQAGKLVANDEVLGLYTPLFGYALAISGDTVFAGAPIDHTGCPPNIPECQKGAAYVHQLAPTATQYGHCPSGSPCNNPDSHGGCRNSIGQGAILAACGSGSVVTDDLEIQVTHCPPNKSTLLFMGGAQAHATYGDGIRVVGGGAPGIFRYGIIQSDADGFAARGPGLVARSQLFHLPGRIQAGQTWYFQVWYRDPPGPCGGFANFSNGVGVAFGP
ncbi:MAG TPA: hypothetical protein VGR31_04415 [Planctomycetota bacterium]|jgi:hypothetical protein|nr:hypothetical protein [Planctomycetota bacterium]